MEHGLFGWLFILVALVLLFGNSKRLSDIGRGMGSFLREFKSAQREGEASLHEAPQPKITPAQGEPGPASLNPPAHQDNPDQHPK